MAYYMTFSALNEKLRPRISTSDRLYSTLNRMEERQVGSLRSFPLSYRPTILTDIEGSGNTAEPKVQQEPEDHVQQQAEDLVSDRQEEGSKSSPFGAPVQLTELSLSDGEEQLVDEEGSLSLAEEKDVPRELGSGSAGGPSKSSTGEDGSPLRRSYDDGTLPDLIRSGRPLGRRRTLGHVSETLKEVRREVELSRRRSIKLKAQVDKLQESREGQGWSQHRERVTEEVLSILRLLSPLTEPDSRSVQPPPDGEKQLDATLAQLQNVARQLAISNTKQHKSGHRSEESAVLQQALYDRDEAIEKKKAMEAELLRSKTEMMLLNNQLLEAVQKRLELSLELEAWKEDFQQILQQQVQSQQQAEQNQKKSSRIGILRRNNRPPIQRPATVPAAAPAPAPAASSAPQIFISKSALSAPPTPSTPPSSRSATHRTWRDKLRRGRTSRQLDLDAAGQDSEADNGFHVVSLD